jgi:hypothetical protein
MWLAASCIAQAQGYLPDPDRTPGAVDPGATLERLCGIPHYSRAVRPPTSYTGPIDAALMHDVGADEAALFELDHRVPLCAGGHPTDRRNLWLEPRTGKWRRSSRTS